MFSSKIVFNGISIHRRRLTGQIRQNIDSLIRRNTQIVCSCSFQRHFSISSPCFKYQPVMLVPIGMDVGLSTVAAGFVRSLQNQGVKVKFFNPVTYNNQEISFSGADEDKILSSFEKPLDIQFLDRMMSQRNTEKLLDYFVACREMSRADSDLVVLQGIKSTYNRSYTERLNSEIARALDAKVVLVSTPGGRKPEEIENSIKIASRDYGNVFGCIFNKVGSPSLDISKEKESLGKTSLDFPVIGSIGWNACWMAPTVKDIVRNLDAEPLFNSQVEDRQVLQFVMAAAMSEIVVHAMKPGKMIITSGDRSDVIASTCAASNNGIPIAGLLLTGGHKPLAGEIIEEAVGKGLPILSVKTDNLQTLLRIQSFNNKTQNTQNEQIRDTIAKELDSELIGKLKTPLSSSSRMSPSAFRYQMIEKARKAGKTIVLPEGEDPRILEAANQCARRNIAKCILLGDPVKIGKNGIDLDPRVETIDHLTLSEKYIAPLMQLRQHKGLTEEEAYKSLQDPIFTGTMMLAEGHVDGLVAGSNTSTARTISPALKLIKTSPGTNLVSSVFFMCLPSQVLVYGDCAVNPNPTVEQLADIAIQSADTAARFGIVPRVAMISYSTGTSGSGPDVLKVKQATNLVRQRRPSLLVDGPIQYDAAFSPEVAKKKSPSSPLGGRATVFVFPDLNTANTAYKAVQRSAGVLSIGPMLQGMNKPVNDLSRGAEVEDIVYTIALTAVQAQ